MLYWPKKAPADVVIYGADWGPTISRLGNGLTITASSWALVMGDVTIGPNTIDTNGLGTNVRISGGTNNTDAIIRNTVTFSDGQVYHTDAYLKIRD